MDYRVDFVGKERQPVLVIENVWPDARHLVEIAAGKQDFSHRSLYYPGLRSNAPPEYVRAIVGQLSDLICSTFGLPNALVITDSTFSLVTTPPEMLVPFQRVPHFDSTDPNRLALLHYLSEHGGTSFYRHRTTGFEVIREDVQDRYIRTVNEEVRSKGLPPHQYVEGDTDLFERTAKYGAAFNRALIYRGNMLHSVNVPQGFVPDANPRTGRLTANTFLAVQPTA